jgi:hypothetical protein
VLPRQPQPEGEQLGRWQGPQPGRVGDRRFDPVAHAADPGPRFVFGDETPLGSAGAGHPHRGDLLAQVVGVSRGAAEVRGIAGGTDAHCHRATVRPPPMVGCCPGDDAGSCARPHDVPSRSLRPTASSFGSKPWAPRSRNLCQSPFDRSAQQLHATAFSPATLVRLRPSSLLVP